jgi:hypothetical protein
MEHLLDDFLVRDLVAEDPELIFQRREAEAEILHTFAGLELDFGEVLSQPLCIGLLHSIRIYVNLADRLPCITH